LVVQLASVCQVFGLLVSQQDSLSVGHSAIWTVGWSVCFGWLVGWSVSQFLGGLNSVGKFVSGFFLCWSFAGHVVWLLGGISSWLAGWWLGWFIGLLVGWLVDSLTGRLFGVWWFGWVVGLLVGCMVGCLVVCWLLSGFVNWLVSWWVGIS